MRNCRNSVLYVYILKCDCIFHYIITIEMNIVDVVCRQYNVDSHHTQLARADTHTHTITLQHPRIKFMRHKHSNQKCMRKGRVLLVDGSQFQFRKTCNRFFNRRRVCVRARVHTHTQTWMRVWLNPLPSFRTGTLSLFFHLCRRLHRYISYSTMNLCVCGDIDFSIEYEIIFLLLQILAIFREMWVHSSNPNFTLIPL